MAVPPPSPRPSGWKSRRPFRPGCGVVEHVQTGEPDQPGDDPLAISENRYRLYRELFAELSDKRRY